jgi:tight adherence protein C
LKYKKEVEKREKKDKGKSGQKKRRKKLAERLYDRFLYPYFAKEKETGKMLRALSPGKRTELELRKYGIRQIQLVLYVLAATLALMICVGISLFLQKGNLTSLQRHEAGGGSYSQELSVEEKGGEKQNVTVAVEEQKLNPEEIYQLFEESGEELETLFLGENTSADRIEHDLSLPSSVSNGLVSVEWSFNNYRVLNPDGSIRSENTEEEGTVVEVSAKMTYRDQEADRIFTIMVYPPLLSEEEAFVQDVENALAQSEEKSSEEKARALPEEANGRVLLWSKSKEYMVWKILVLGLLMVILICYESRQSLKRKLEERVAQMQMDYSQIVNQIAILTGAGMPIFKAWERIVQDYVKKGREKRYAYEEMLLIYKKIKEGLRETNAYEQFGENCGLREYRRLALLLNRNIKLGAAGMGRLLEREATEAFEERKALARARGEEAGTKLLLPMMIYLLLVVFIVVVPGFISFSGI